VAGTRGCRRQLFRNQLFHHRQPGDGRAAPKTHGFGVVQDHEQGRGIADLLRFQR
jgi:hypothetical protein